MLALTRASPTLSRGERVPRLLSLGGVAGFEVGVAEAFGFEAGGEAGSGVDAALEEGVEARPFAAEDAVAFVVIGVEVEGVGEEAVLGDGHEADGAFEAADGEEFGHGGVFEGLLEACEVVEVGLDGGFEIAGGG